LALHGLFVAGVTGSFVVAEAQFAAHDDSFLIKVLAIPDFFAAGVLTTLIVAVAGERSWWALATTLAFVAALLTGLLAMGLCAPTFDNPKAASSLVAALLGLSTMGMQNALVRLFLQGYGTTNVMTANTTQLAIDVAVTVLAWCKRRGNPGDATTINLYVQATDRVAQLLPIVFGFLVGTVAGGMAYLAFGLMCLMVVIGILAALVIWTALSPFPGCNERSIPSADTHIRQYLSS
jgi:uncharacterized membrane protein YoaK (UPF0700 family)